jgi:excisionase family DNA binding protein
MVITVAEAAEMLRVSENTIRNAIRSGRLPALRLGTGQKSGAYRILRDDFETFLAWCKEQAPVEPAVKAPDFRPVAFRHVDVSRWLAAQSGRGGRRQGGHSVRLSPLPGGQGEEKSI